MAPIIFHIDVNSAYLSWTAVEQLKNGAAVDLREIPAIIGGDQKSRHGVVLAKSPAAKRYGIRTGEPVANAFRKCPNLAMYPPDHKMYREKSRRLGFHRNCRPVEFSCGRGGGDQRRNKGAFWLYREYRNLYK